MTSLLEGGPTISGSTVKEHATGGDELQQIIEIGDIGGEHREAELLCLEEQHTIVKGTQPRVLMVPLQPAQHARKQRGPRQHVGMGSEGAMRQHGGDQNADLLADAVGPRIGGIEHTDCVHQLLDRDRRVVGYSDT